MCFRLIPLFIFICMSSSACVIPPVAILPIPHMETTVSSVEGIIRNNSDPVGNRTVVLKWGRLANDEWEYSAETKTSEKGEFQFPGKSTFKPVTTIIAVADCRFSYRLALKAPEQGSGIILAEEDFLFGCTPPKRIRVHCDLARTGRDRCSISLE
jgi:hypothetical protein